MTLSLLEQGIQAAQAGQHEKARALLARAVRENPDSEQAWLGLAAVVDDDWQKLHCLRQAQRINPQNQAAACSIEALTYRLDVPAVRPESSSSEQGFLVSSSAPATPQEEQADPGGEGLSGPTITVPAPPIPRSGGSSRWIEAGVFVAQRLLFGGVILLAITFLTYLGLDMAEGTSLQEALVHATGNTVAYIGRLLQGDLGTSVAGSLTYASVPIAQVVIDVVSKSLGLLAVALALAAIVGVPLGFWAARRRHTGWSLVILLVSIIGVSIPSFFAALLLQLILIRWTRAFGRPLLPVGGFGWDERIILPALVLAARPVAQIARMTFISISDILDLDYVRTARSKGLGSRQVMIRHVIRNGAIPILTTMGVSLRFALSSLPVVEFFFNWTGMGFTLLKSIARGADNLTVTLVLCLGALFVLVNLLLELVYRLVDPRLRERISQAQRQEREDLLQIGKSLLVGLRDGFQNLLKRLANSPPVKWLARSSGARKTRTQRTEPWQPQADPSPFHAALESRGITVDLDAQEHKVERRRAWIRGTVSNVPFMIGALLVGVLLFVFVFGPGLTPHSPYTKRGLEYSDGKLTVPPFAPDETFRWGTDPLGRDIQSLIVAGAQQTLLLVVLVVSVRLVLGVLLGSLAGWLSGGWVDRTLLGLAEIIAAFPALLLAMILILALGIRQGMQTFVIALSLIGWGEIMQFVRSEVMAIRVRPFIESAVSTGIRTPRIVLGHVLPNVLSSLISIAALEMGAVLMLLGELGFIGIFIGGGAFAELQIDAPPYHYSDVPEWAALLSNVRLYARTYPWTALYPATAFFVAILGFNLLGEGIRRLVETVGVGFTRLFNRYTVTATLLVALGIGWAKSNTGSLAYYRRQAANFDGERALADARALTDPSLEGRALDSPGLETAADRIAGSFASVDLQSAGQEMGYLQQRARSYQALDAIPQLTTTDMEDVWTYREDYVEYPGVYRNMGQFTGPIQVLMMGEQTQVRATFGRLVSKGLAQLDLSGSVVLALSERDAFYLGRMALDGLLVVAEDETDLQRRYTLSTRDPTGQVFGTGRQVGQDTPTLWISQAMADRLLASSGYTVADLRRQAAQQQQDAVLQIPIDVNVAMQIEGTIHDKVPTAHIIGHLPGQSDSRYGGINTQAIVVLAQYDNPPISPEGAFHPAANDNASGVATMVELVRTMGETGYQPYRTFLFIAYSGEGLEGGEPVSPSDVAKFLQAKPGLAAGLEVEAIVHLRGLGAGEGDTLTISATGSRRLAKLFEESARQMGVPASQAEEAVDLSIVFEEKSRRERGQEAPEITLSWEGWEMSSRTPGDTQETLSADSLEQAGQALTLALMVLGRELQY